MSNKNEVTNDQAAAIHALLVDVLEGSLRQQLMSGEYSPQMVARALDFLKHNNITVASADNKRMVSLLDAFKQVDIDDL